MFNEMTDGMFRQITLIEMAIGRKLSDSELDELKELRSGLFYITPDEIVQVEGEEARKVSYFLLEPELQHDIWLLYGSET